MAFYIGRSLQVVGMAELAWALYVGFVRGDWKSELVNLAFGALLFLTGRLLERRFARA